MMIPPETQETWEKEVADLKAENSKLNEKLFNLNAELTFSEIQNKKLLAAMPDPDELDYHAGEIIPISLDSAQSLIAMADKIREAKP